MIEQRGSTYRRRDRDSGFGFGDSEGWLQAVHHTIDANDLVSAQFETNSRQTPWTISFLHRVSTSFGDNVMRSMILLLAALVISAPANAQSWRLKPSYLETINEAHQRRDAERYLWQREQRERGGVASNRGFPGELRESAPNTLSNDGLGRSMFDHRSHNPLR